jgi:hypothetical protein
MNRKSFVHEINKEDEFQFNDEPSLNSYKIQENIHEEDRTSSAGHKYSASSS